MDGADVNAVWADQNALSFAIMYEQKEIEAYLRSKGALATDKDRDADAQADSRY